MFPMGREQLLNTNHTEKRERERDKRKNPGTKERNEMVSKVKQKGAGAETKEGNNIPEAIGS